MSRGRGAGPVRPRRGD